MNSFELLKIYVGSAELLDTPFITYNQAEVLIHKISNPRVDGRTILAEGVLSIDGQSIIGPIALLERASQWDNNPTLEGKNIALLVALDNDKLICKLDGSVLPTIEVALPQGLMEKFDQIIDNAQNYSCGNYIASLPRIEFVNLCTKLLIERIEMKCGDIDEILEFNNYDWNQTYYTMLVRMIGMGRNQSSYLKVANRVSYKIICREKHSRTNIEALLFGAAGLLEDPMDDYQMSLAREFAHLQNKYGIRPLRQSDWDFGKTRPASNTFVRLAQIAAIVCSKSFMFDSAMKCRTVEDIEKLYDCDISEYWETHYIFGSQTRSTPKNISTDTVATLGTNVVCFLMLRYGKFTQDDGLREAAIDLLESIKADKNRIILEWTKRGIEIDNAYFSQAMLQLSKIYCSKKHCGSCFVCKGRLKSE